MAAAHWKPKSLYSALPIFLLLLNLLPEARYDSTLYLTPSGWALALLDISLLPPLESFRSPETLVYLPGDVFCIIPVLIRFPSRSRHGNLSSTIRNNINLYYELGKKFGIKQ